MPGRPPRLHLPYARWPAADQSLWQCAMGSDDPFSDAAGARLAKTTQRQYQTGWRRFLGFLAIEEPAALDIAPAQRLTSSASGRSPLTLPQLISPDRSRSRSMRFIRLRGR